MEALFLIMILIAVVAVAGVLFCVWAIVTALRSLARTLFGPPRAARPAGNGQACGHDGCLCPNPVHARFCRRCGRPLPALLRLVGSRAA